MNDKDLLTVETMKKFGGSFVQSLAVMAIHADPVNLQKIKDTWPLYWKEYERLSNRDPTRITYIKN